MAQDVVRPWAPALRGSPASPTSTWRSDLGQRRHGALAWRGAARPAWDVGRRPHNGPAADEPDACNVQSCPGNTFTVTDVPAVVVPSRRDEEKTPAPRTLRWPVSWRLGPWRVAFAAAVLCLTAGVLGEPVADELDLAELGHSLAAVVSATHLGAISRSVRVPYLPVLATLAVLHYVAAAAAVRAVAGLRGRAGEIGLVQLAAAAANRITPVGLGAGAVNVRYLCRRGSSPAQAIGAVAALGVLGAAADLVVTLAVWLADQGKSASSRSATGLLRLRLAHALRGFSPAPLLRPVVLVVLAGLLLGLWQLRRTRTSTAARSRRLTESARQAAALALALRRRPMALLVLMVSSGATTAILAVAFVVSVHAVAGGHATTGITTLLLLFLVSSAAASSVPTPAGIGATEGALVAVLLLAHDTTAHALQAVILFRLVTFWAPVPLGLLAARALRRRGML